MEDVLYIIVPYFNFLGINKLEENLNLFLTKNKFTNKARVVLSEGYIDHELKDYSNLVYKHFKFKFKDIFWAKENLINLAIDKLPKDWKFVVWVDRDVVFSSEGWIEKAIEELEVSDIIQPWSLVMNPTANKNNTLLNSSPTSIHLKMNQSNLISNSIKQGFFSKMQETPLDLRGHPGFAWGINKNFYTKIKKIPDWFIVGAADSVLASCCVYELNKKNILHKSPHATIPMELKFHDYAKSFKDVKFNSLNFEIFHVSHGTYENRKYIERHSILQKHNFNPDCDIFYNEQNVIEFSKDWRTRAATKIKDFFISRQENL